MSKVSVAKPNFLKAELYREEKIRRGKVKRKNGITGGIKKVDNRFINGIYF